MKTVKTFGILTFIMFLGISLSGCALMAKDGAWVGACWGPQKWVDREGNIQTMERPEETALCRIDPYWTDTEIALFAVNAFALKKGKYKPTDVYAVIESIRTQYYSKPGISVGQLATYASLQIGQSPELFIASKTLERYAKYVDMPMDDFSWYQINKHLQDQELLAKMYE